MPEPRNIDDRIDAIAQSVELLTIDVHELQATVHDLQSTVHELQATMKAQIEFSAGLAETAARQAEAAARQAESIGQLAATAREDHQSLHTLKLALLEMTAAESRMTDALAHLLKITGEHANRIHTLETR